VEALLALSGVSSATPPATPDEDILERYDRESSCTAKDRSTRDRLASYSQGKWPFSVEAVRGSGLVTFPALPFNPARVFIEGRN
jgi:hypothetical protein